MFIKRIIKEYYSKRPLEEPLYLHKREIAIHSLENDVYIRHLNFTSMRDLYDYILNVKTPLHLYYSSALYENPSAERMELKEWVGSELMFDIDVDTYMNCDRVLSICINDNEVHDGKVEQCRDGSKPIYHNELTTECFSKAIGDVLKLIDILTLELGFREVKVYFSGNKGFHIKVYDPEIYGLTGDDRREILSYVRLDFFEAETNLPKHRGKLVLSKDEFGVRRRLLNLVYKHGVPFETMGELIVLDYGLVENLINDLKVNVDPVVTIDVSRLSRFNHSLNCKSGLTVKPLDPDKLGDFNPLDASPWLGSFVVKPKVDATLTIFGSRVRLKAHQTIQVDSTTGFYLVLRGIVDVLDTRDFGIK